MRIDFRVQNGLTRGREKNNKTDRRCIMKHENIFGISPGDKLLYFSIEICEVRD